MKKLSNDDILQQEKNIEDLVFLFVDVSTPPTTPVSTASAFVNTAPLPCSSVLTHAANAVSLSAIASPSAAVLTDMLSQTLDYHSQSSHPVCWLPEAQPQQLVASSSSTSQFIPFRPRTPGVLQIQPSGISAQPAVYMPGGQLRARAPLPGHIGASITGYSMPPAVPCRLCPSS